MHDSPATASSSSVTLDTPSLNPSLRFTEYELDGVHYMDFGPGQGSQDIRDDEDESQT